MVARKQLETGQDAAHEIMDDVNTILTSMGWSLLSEVFCFKIEKT